MQDKRSAEIKVGLVSLVALILLVLGIILGKGLSISNANQVKFRFPNSGGIQTGSPVTINGVSRGTVSSIENDNGSVLIKADLKNVEDIFSDATAKISMMELTGGRKIEMNPGISKIKFDKNNEIIGITNPDFSDLLGMLGSLSDGLTNTLDKLDSVASSVNIMFADGEINKKIRSSLSNTESLTNDLHQLLSNNKNNINSAINDLKTISNELKSSVQANEPKISKIVDNIDAKINELSKIFNKAENGLANIENLSKDLNSILSDIKTGNGTLNKLIYDKKFSNQLDTTLRNLNILMKNIDKKGLNANVRLGVRD